MRLETPSERARRPRGRLELGLALGAYALFWMSLYVYVPVLPTYARDLGAPLGVVGLVVSVYGLAQIVLRIPLGLASDRLGRRKPFVYGGLLASAAGAATLALAPAAWALALGRAIVGVGASTFVVSLIYLADLFPSGQLARAVSVLVAVSQLSQVVILIAGGLVAERWGVPTTFWAAAGLALAGMLLLAPVPERPPTGSQSVGIGSLVRSGLRRDVVTVSAIAAVLQYGTFGLTYAFLPVYARDLGATESALGLLTTAAVAASALAALALAFVGDRVHARGAVMVGFLMAALSAAAVPMIADLGVLTASQALGGFGRGLVFAPLATLSIRRVPPRERGAAMGVFQAVYALGMFLGPATSGALAEWLGLDRMFLVVAALSIMGALAAARWLGRDEPAAEASTM